MPERVSVVTLGYEKNGVEAGIILRQAAQDNASKSVGWTSDVLAYEYDLSGEGIA